MNPTIKITVLTSLYNCTRYLNGYFESLAKLNKTDNIEILLLHNSPSKDELDIINRWLPKFPFVSHIIIPEREGLYVTWNRGINIAKGEYVCIWNVDDIRMPDSIADQAETLDNNPEAVLTYGDFLYMYRYQEFTEILHSYEDFSKNKSPFFKSHQIGCFPMWRKSVHEKTGYFDEQFKLVSDFDFQIRIARNSTIVKTNKILGYYLEFVSEKLSSNTWLQSVERNAIYLRYGIFDFFNWLTLFSIIKRYKINHILCKNNIIPLKNVFDSHRSFQLTRLPLIILSVFRQPRYILAYFKHEIFKK